MNLQSFTISTYGTISTISGVIRQLTPITSISEPMELTYTTFDAMGNSNSISRPIGTTASTSKTPWPTTFSLGHVKPIFTISEAIIVYYFLTLV
ncbi:unnamed protein product [Cunninghamella echinulata]